MGVWIRVGREFREGAVTFFNRTQNSSSFKFPLHLSIATGLLNVKRSKEAVSLSLLKVGAKV